MATAISVRGPLEEVPDRRVPQRATGRSATRSPARVAACRGAVSTTTTSETSGRSATSRSTSPEGEVLGIVGRNGAGKSTLAQDPDADHVADRGPRGDPRRVGSLLEVGTGFHPELTGRENVFLNGSDPRDEAARDRQRSSTRSSSSPASRQFLDTPVKRYSSGMSVRLAFAVAAHLEPEILLVDEVLAVGDAEFQRRCLGRMEDLSQSGRTVVFVSHQMQAVAQLCDRAIWLEQGRVVRDGPSADVVARVPAGRVRSGLAAGVGRSRRRRPATTSSDCARCESSRTATSVGAVDVRESGRDRDPRSTCCGEARRSSRRSRSYDSRGRRRFQRDGHERALARSVASRRVRGDRVDPRETTSTRGSRRSTSASCRSARRSCSRMPAARSPSRSTSRIPARATPRAACSPGSGRASSARCSSGRPRSGKAASVGLRIVGSVLVRNEDLFVEQAVRNVVKFLRRDPHRRPCVRRWDVGNRPVAGARVRSHRCETLGELRCCPRTSRAVRRNPDVGHRRRRRRALRSARPAGAPHGSRPRCARGRVQAQGACAQLRGARPIGQHGVRLARSAVTSRYEAVQLRCRGVVAQEPRPTPERQDRLPKRIRLGDEAGPRGYHDVGVRIRFVCSTSAFCAGRHVTSRATDAARAKSRRVAGIRSTNRRQAETRRAQTKARAPPPRARTTWNELEA